MDEFKIEIIQERLKHDLSFKVCVLGDSGNFK